MTEELVAPVHEEAVVVPARVRAFVAPAGETGDMASLATLETRTKDPAEVLDFVVDWSGAYPGPALEDAETITASAFTADAGITIDSSSATTTTTTCWLSGGTAGEAYKVTNEITTSAGRTLVFSFKVWVRDR